MKAITIVIVIVIVIVLIGIGIGAYFLYKKSITKSVSYAVSGPDIIISWKNINVTPVNLSVASYDLSGDESTGMPIDSLKRSIVTGTTTTIQNYKTVLPANRSIIFVISFVTGMGTDTVKQDLVHTDSFTYSS